MSFWHAPLFGTGPKTTPRPASPAAIRCARIRCARSLEPARSAIVGFIIGKTAMIASVLVGATLGLPAIGPQPGPGGVSSLLAFAAEGLRSGRSQLPSILFTLVFVAVFIAAFPIMGRWVFDLTAHRINSYTQHRARRARRFIRKFMISLCVVYGLMLAAIAFSFGISAIVIAGAALGVLLSPMAITTGVVTRSGRHLTCARCGYPMGSWRSAAAHCPECGGNWRQPWRHTIGDRRVSWWWVAGGTVATAACMAILIIMFVTM